MALMPVCRTHGLALVAGLLSCAPAEPALLAGRALTVLYQPELSNGCHSLV